MENIDLTSLVFVLFVLSLYAYVKPVTIEYRNNLVVNRSGIFKVVLSALFDSLVFIFSMLVCAALFYALNLFH